MSERPNAMLTKADRAFLIGNKRFEGPNAKQRRYQRRESIRTRILHTLVDFSILREHMDRMERQKVFRQLYDVDEDSDLSSWMLFNGIDSMLYWIYLGFKEQGDDFERYLEDAIAHAEREYARTHTGEIVETSVAVDIKTTRRRDIEGVLQRMEADIVYAYELYRILTSDERERLDVDDIDTIGVFGKKEDKEVLETMFDQFLNVDIEIEIVDLTGSEPE